uniref:Uncharacterized protein n=1 Tax=Grammatophora oceanica TaxID=210454 RepID=A0A7S1ULX6_9STRA
MMAVPYLHPLHPLPEEAYHGGGHHHPPPPPPRNAYFPPPSHRHHSSASREQHPHYPQQPTAPHFSQVSGGGVMVEGEPNNMSPAVDGSSRMPSPNSSTQQQSRRQRPRSEYDGHRGQGGEDEDARRNARHVSRGGPHHRYR